MQVSLVVTTYNWKEALRLSLLSAFRQGHLPQEILVGDDGSREDTRELIQELSKIAPVPLHHLWQEDLGFRAARSRNACMARAKGEYIVIIDGDIILHKDFIADHLGFSKKGFFTQGSRVLLGPEVTSDLLKNNLESAPEFSFFSKDIKNRKNTVRSGCLSKVFSHSKKSLKGIRSANMSFWREDVLKINGFNEDFKGWGREDSEFALRMLNSGVCRQDLKFKALAYHLYHKENPRDDLKSNDAILEEAIKNKVAYCSQGLNNHL
jgi:glycosyltransferase involved in cell wall biosynthesis